MAVNVEEDKTDSNKYVVIKVNTENSMDGTNKGK